MKHTTAAVIQDTGEARQRRKRYMLWSFLLLIAMTLVLPLIPYAVAYVQDGSAVRNPGSELWREVRQRDQAVIGQTQADNVDAGILINKRGEEWRLFRMKKLIPFGAILIGGILGLIILFYLIRGTLRLPGGRSGKRILRFTLNERIVHWFTVVIFWILALSGLITLYGRYVLVPLLGPEGFSVTASASLMAHNTLGPIFLVAILALFFTFVKNNFFARGDLKWLSKAGGLLGGHASAGRFNAGEKIWFWLAVILGLALCVSGLILDFPNWGQGRVVFEWSHVVHGISAVVMIAVSFGHIYLGTVGMEGSLESMTTGYVDATWAEAHHDRWYEEVRNAGEIEEPGQSDLSGGVASGGVAQSRSTD